MPLILKPNLEKNRMNTSIFSYTEEGFKVQQNIEKILGLIRFRGENISIKRSVRCSNEVKDAFSDSQCIIFVGAAGIAVRLSAPYLKDKLTDPAIIVVDEGMNFVIPLASGHVGGANSLSKLIADKLNATPVITTATDVEGVFSIDEFAAANGLFINKRDGIKKVAKKLLNGEAVSIAFSDDVIVSTVAENSDENLLSLLMRPYVVGMGCKRGKAKEEVEQYFLDTIKHLNIDIKNIIAIASIDIKKDEEAFIYLSEKYKIPFVTYTADELNNVEGEFESSEFVAKTVGVSDVSQRAAKKCGGAGTFVLKKDKRNGMTISVFEKLRRVNLSYE